MLPAGDTFGAHRVIQEHVGSHRDFLGVYRGMENGN